MDTLQGRRYFRVGDKVISLGVTDAPVDEVEAGKLKMHHTCEFDYKDEINGSQCIYCGKTKVNKSTTVDSVSCETNKFIIRKRDGNVDVELEDGVYTLNKAVVTIKNGVMSSIDNGTWEKIAPVDSVSNEEQGTGDEEWCNCGGNVSATRLEGEQCIHCYKFKKPSSPKQDEEIELLPNDYKFLYINGKVQARIIDTINQCASAINKLQRGK